MGMKKLTHPDRTMKASPDGSDRRFATRSWRAVFSALGVAQPPAGEVQTVKLIKSESGELEHASNIIQLVPVTSTLRKA